MPVDIPAQREGPLKTSEVLKISEVSETSEISNANDLVAQLDQEQITPLKECRVNESRNEILTTKDHGVAVVYDFGEVVAGYIRFEVEGSAGAIIDFYPGEQLLPDGRVRIFDGIPGFDPQIAHRYILRDGKQTWERFEFNGLRYLQVTYRNCLQPLRVHAVTVNQTNYPVEPRGQLNVPTMPSTKFGRRARALCACMHDAFVDCPSREQRHGWTPISTRASTTPLSATHN